MAHHTKDKGDLAVIKTIADLSEKGYVAFVPVACEHLPFDLIAYKEGKSYRIQVKYSVHGDVRGTTSWSSKKGNHIKQYNENDFDYYAIYLSNKNIICYPSIKYKGITLATEINNSPTPFYWYEDFLEFTDEAEKKTFRDFNITLTRPSIPKPNKINKNKPTKEDLEKLIWQHSMVKISKMLKVSDVSIKNWIIEYGLEKPPVGYWNRKTL